MTDGRRQLIVLVDALGWLTAERTGFLADRLPFRRRLTTVFGYSSTAVPSLLTGAWPRDHGHWFLYRRARGRSPFVGARWIDALPGGLGRRWRVRSRLQEFWRRRAGIRGYFSLYDVPLGILPGLEPVEVADTWAPGAFPDTPTLVDHLVRGSRGYHVSDWRRSDAEKIDVALRILAERDPAVVVLYLTEVDSEQHRVGTTAPEFDAAVRRAGERIETFLRSAEERGPWGVTVFSDHGMTDVTTSRDLFAVLREAGLERGRDFDAFLDSTVARFWNVRDEAALRGALASATWGRVLSPETLAAWRVDFPARDYGDLFFLADPGVLILPSDMGSAPLAAMHGYDPGHPTSDACLLADAELPLRDGHIVEVLPALLARIGEKP